MIIFTRLSLSFCLSSLVFFVCMCVGEPGNKASEVALVLILYVLHTTTCRLVP